MNELTTRPASRVDYHKPCKLLLRGLTHRGIIHNISSSGLFIQTMASGFRGHPAEILIPGSLAHHTVCLQATVARRQPASREGGGVFAAGLGLQIIHASNEYEALLAGEDPVEYGLRRSKPSYTVRVLERGQFRSRIVKLDCVNEEAALRQVQLSIPNTWKILDVWPS